MNLEKENILRGRRQVVNLIVNLAFDYQSNCILSKLEYRRPIMLQFERLVGLGFEGMFCLFDNLIISHVGNSLQYIF